MNFSFITAANIIRKCNGVDMEFGYLTIDDWKVLATKLESIQHKNNHELIKRMQEAGIKPGQLPPLLRQINRPPLYTEVYDYILTPEGAVEALFLSLKKKHPEIKVEDVAKMAEIAKLVSLAAELSAFEDITYPTTVEEGKKDFLTQEATSPKSPI